MQERSRFLLPLFITFTSCTLFGQQKAESIHGRVNNLNNDVSNVLIINLNSRRSTISDSLGLFTIEAELRDSIRFTAVQYLPTEIIVTDTIFNQKWFEVNLVDNVIDLSEVIVTPYNLTGKLNLDIDRLGIEPAVTSSSLELPNAGLEVMTQSERLLLEADRGKYVQYYGIAIVINTHKIMNRLSGRTKTFEGMVARDENMELEKEIISKFSKETISEDFGIPKSNIDGFLTYCLSQSDFSDVSKAGNMVEIWEYLRTRSIEFKETDLIEK